MRTVAAVLAVAVMSCSLVVRPAWGQSSGWKRPDLRPVSQPSVVGDRVVLYVAAGGGLRVLALDAATGTTVWSHDATTSEMAPGEEPGLAIMGSEVVYLAKGPDSTAPCRSFRAFSVTAPLFRARCRSRLYPSGA